MNILVKRDYFTDRCTLGKMYVDGVYLCETLEDCDRSLEDGTHAKVAGATAIPRGEYKVIIDFSNRFQKDMPHIIDVPNFEGVRIHSGNTDKDTEGCILVGMDRDQNAQEIINSRLAFGAFFEKLQTAIRLNQDVTIEVK